MIDGVAYNRFEDDYNEEENAYFVDERYGGAMATNYISQTRKAQNDFNKL